MKALIIDADPLLDETARRTFYLRGYDVRTARSRTEARKLIANESFDCIALGVPPPGGHNGGELAEIRRFAQQAGVALMTAIPTESIIGQALADGSIELQPGKHLVTRIRRLAEPILVVASKLNPDWIPMLREESVVAHSANNLARVMKLLVDDSCHVVLLTANIPSLTGRGTAAIFLEITTSLLAVLASALASTPSGVVHGMRPQTALEFIDLIEQTAENRLGHCGLAEARKEDV